MNSVEEDKMKDEEDGVEEEEGGVEEQEEKGELLLVWV